MAIWTRFPETTEVKNSYDLRRTPQKSKVKGIFTSDFAESTPVHYFGGRTVPHTPAEGCIPCEHANTYRYVAYFAYLDLADDTHCVFEVTAMIHAEIERAGVARNGVRGLQFQSYRPSGRLNGRLSFTFKRNPKALEGLPDAPDVRKIMQHIWQPSLDVMLATSAKRGPEAASNGRMIPVTQTT